MLEVMATERIGDAHGTNVKRIPCVQIIVNGLVFERDCASIQTAQRLAEEVRREIKRAR